VDLRKNGDPESVAEKEDLTAQVLDWARDRTEALEGSSTASQEKPSQETNRDRTEAFEGSSTASEVQPSQETKVNQHKNHSSEPIEEKEDLTAQVLDWARDRTEALEGSSTASEAKPSQETNRDRTEALEGSSTASEVKPSQERKTKAPPRVIVVALHEGTDNGGEAHLFEDLEAAGRFVETLVEEGLDQQRLTVFNCTPLIVHLTYRPVVQLKASEAEEEPDV